MRALLSRDVGGPDTLTLTEVPDPVAGPGQVVLRVEACGVNFPDVLIIEDRYQFKPQRPFAPGGEVAGIVATVGEGVTLVQPGDRVIGSAGWGGMAEKILLDEARCTPMPDGMTFEEASAFTMTYGTSFHALEHRALLKAGETILVLGAAGGVGLAAVELAKARGARVVAACSSQEKLDVCLRHGADAGVVYPREIPDKSARKALADLFKAAVGERGADVIYDAVGGDYAEAALRSIAWEGRYLVVGFPAGIPAIPLNLTLLKGCQIIGVFYGAWIAKDRAKRLPEVISELSRLYSCGLIHPLVSETYPLHLGGEAIRALAQRSVHGKVVVVPRSS